MRARFCAWLAPALLAGCWAPGTYRTAPLPERPALLLPSFEAPAALDAEAAIPPALGAESARPSAPRVPAEDVGAIPTRRPRAAAPEEFARDLQGDAWLQGRIVRVPVGPRCQWKLQYAPPEPQNPFAGAALLEGYIPDDLRTGELVQAEGGFLPVGGMQAPIYRCTRVQRLAGRDDRP